MKPAVVFVSAEYQEKVKAACASESGTDAPVPVLLQLEPFWPAGLPEPLQLRPPVRAKTDLAAVLFTR